MTINSANCILDPNFPDRWQPAANWHKILFRDDKELQTAELIEIQSMLGGQLKAGWDSVYKNGTIIKGMQAAITGIGTTPVVNFTDGIIYVEGSFLYVPASLPLNILGVGIENVVLSIRKTIITEQDDPNLKNPQTGGILYGQPGAAREIWLGSLAISPDPQTGTILDGYLIKSFKDGQAIIPRTFEDDLLDKVTGILAERTFEESGNYCLEGLSVTAASLVASINSVNTAVQRITVDRGKAYVRGYRVNKTISTSKDIIQPSDAIVVNNAQYSLGLNYSSHTQLFTLSGGLDFGPGDTGKKLTISIVGIIPAQTAPIVVSYTIQGGDTLASVLSKLDVYLSSDPNNSFLASLPESLTVTAAGSSDIEARQLLFSYLYFEKQSANSLKVAYKNSNATTPLVKITYQAKDNLGVESAFTSINFETGQQTLSNGQGYPSLVLPFSPVKEIGQINIDNRVYREAVIRGGIPGTSDSLSKSTAFQIDSIISADGLIYTPGVDFNNTNSNVIDWSANGPGSKEPAASSLYFVTYLYTDSLIPTTDYLLTDRKTITFLKKAPVPTRQLRITYAYYLKRTDTVCLDKSGNIVVTQGVESASALAPTPSSDLLPLANIEMVNGEPARIYPLACRSFTMSDIQKLEDRITNTEYQIAVSQLDSDALDKSTNLVTDLKGSFNENFLNLSKADLSNPSFSAALYPALLGARPSFQLTQYQLVNNLNSLTSTSRFINHMLDADGSITPWKAVLPYSNEVIISQTRKTGFFNLQPHNVPVRAAMIMLQPSVDNAATLTTNKQTVVIPVLRPDLNLSGASAAQALQDAKTAVNSLNLDASSKVTVSNKIVQSVVERTSTTERLGDIITSLPFLNQQTIRVTGELFKPNANNLQIYFNNVLVREETGTSPTPRPGLFKRVGSTSAGSILDSFKATLDGTIDVLFTVPAETPTGRYDITVKNGENEARATYSGDNVIIQQNYRTTVNEVRYNLTKVSVSEQDVWDSGHGARQRLEQLTGLCIGDPLAQSFSLEENRLITGIKIRFRSKSTETSDNYVLVQLRNMINGYPGSDVLTQTRLSPQDITISNNGSAVTTAIFDIPFITKAQPQEYCVVLYSPSNKYEVYTATLGEKDFITDTTVGEQAYLNGVFFTSSNNTTWTANQNTDLTFELLAANFTSTTSIVEFTAANATDITSFALNAKEVIPEKTSIDYYYSIDNGANYFKFDAGTVNSIPYSNPITQATVGTVGSILFKAILRGTNHITPMLGIDTITASLYRNKTIGAWVSKSVDYQQTYNTVSIILQRIMFSGTTIQIDISSDEGATWIAVPETAIKLIDGNINLEQVTYSLTNLSTTTIVNNQNVQRTKFKWRARFTAADSKIMPLIRRVITLAHLE